MQPSDWQHIKRHLQSILECSPAMRTRLADQLCAGRPAWRAEIDALLGEVDESLSGFLEAEESPAPASPRTYWPGRALGHWRVGRLLGSGGSGHVFEAHSVEAHSFEAHPVEARSGKATAAPRYAIKVLDAPNGTTPALTRNLAREHDLQRRLSHPAIVGVLEADVTGPQPYLVTDLVEGLPIDAYCRDHALGVPERVRLVLRLVDAVQHAHGRGVIHCDIKAANVMVTLQGAVKLLDFGIAVEAGEVGDAACDDGSVAFSPESAAPELVRRGRISPATDVYGVAALLYALLTGHAPHRVGPRATLFDAVQAAQRGKPMRASDRIRRDGIGSRCGLKNADALSKRLEQGLDRVLEHALAPDPARRHPTLVDLRSDLLDCLDPPPRRGDDNRSRCRSRGMRIDAVALRAREPIIFPSLRNE